MVVAKIQGIAGQQQQQQQQQRNQADDAAAAAYANQADPYARVRQMEKFL